MTDGNDWYSDRSATFGDRLAGARQAAGMTQSQLAKRLGVKVKTLRSWEEDLAEPRANRLSMLSGLLAVSLSWLLTGEGDGLDGPVEQDMVPADITEIMVELRQMKAEMMRTTDQIGRLEKRLRKAAESFQ